MEGLDSEELAREVEKLKPEDRMYNGAFFALGLKLNRRLRLLP